VLRSAVAQSCVQPPVSVRIRQMERRLLGKTGLAVSVLGSELRKSVSKTRNKRPSIVWLAFVPMPA
jgi:hypothetical protein